MANQKVTITFKDVKKDDIEQIEVTAPGKIRASKKAGDDVTWNVVNLTGKDLDVAVIDFYAMTIISTGAPSGGGYPFSGGKPPAYVTVPFKGGRVATLPILADGDADTRYKYSIVARVSGETNQWFLVKDPELDIEL